MTLNVNAVERNGTSLTWTKQSLSKAILSYSYFQVGLET